MIRVPFITCALIVAVASCSKPDPVAVNARAPNLTLPANHAAPDPAAMPPPNAATTPDREPMTSTAAIPAALQGRWGLTPGDCTSTRGDSKGLLIITAQQLRFYESRALPSSDAHGNDDSISGTFNFSGEGQSWSKFVALQRKGEKLTRTETNPAASYTYAKC